MYKLIGTIIFYLVIYKITDPNLKNVFNFSDRYIMSVVPEYIETYINNRWNYDLDSMNELEISYDFYHKINNLVDDYNSTKQCRHILYINGKKHRLATVLPLTDSIKKKIGIYKSVEKHPIRIQKILVDIIDQLPKSHVIYKVGIVKKDRLDGLFVAGIEKNVAFLSKILRDKLVSIVFTHADLGHYGLDIDIIDKYKEVEPLVFKNWKINNDIMIDIFN